MKAQDLVETISRMTDPHQVEEPGPDAIRTLTWLIGEAKRLTVTPKENPLNDKVSDGWLVNQAVLALDRCFSDSDYDTDDQPKVSRGERGAYVSAWIWVAYPEIDEQEAMGRAVAKLLDLKELREVRGDPPRYKTIVGTKTAKGLGSIIERITEEGGQWIK